MFELRPYQREALNAVHLYWQNGGGNALVVLPTGSGKSLIIAALCKEMLEDYPTMRIAIATHVRELIAQDYKELLALWPEAPVGIYSAGIGRRDRDAKILFMGVQSIWRKVHEIGPVDLLLIDEAHLVSHNKATTYRHMMDELKARTLDMRIAGLTATPFRLDSGRLDTGRDKIFDDVVYSANVKKLIKDGYLCKLISKRTVTEMSVEGVGKHAGEFITKELEVAVDQDHITRPACEEMVQYGGDGKRRAWLIFCVTVAHANHVVEILRELGIDAHAVFGKTPKEVRDRIVDAFRAGEFTCLVSVMVLGIGFNVPHVDMINLMRPTASCGLYVQQVGRGLRNAEGKTDCLVLDFAGNMKRHGPIDQVSGRTQGTLDTSKVCPECRSILDMKDQVCPDCGYEFKKEAKDALGETAGPTLPDKTADADRDIISDDTPRWLNVKRISYRKHAKYGDPTAPNTLRVDYLCGLLRHSEWVCFNHVGYAQEKAFLWWRKRAATNPPMSVDEALARVGELAEPLRIMVRPEGRFVKILNVELQQTLDLG